MIRANLLPRRRETVSLFSFELDIDLLREMGLGLAIVAIVALIGIGIERFRLDSYANAAAGLEAQVAANAARREDSRRLMLDVARYQEFEREEAQYRRSGAVAAIAVARIGNSVPANVWVNDITRVENGFTLTGGSHSLDAIAGTISSLARDNPNAHASLSGIENSEQAGKGVHFSAKVVSEPVPTAPPVVARPVPAR